MKDSSPKPLSEPVTEGKIITAIRMASENWKDERYDEPVFPDKRSAFITGFVNGYAASQFKEPVTEGKTAEEILRKHTHNVALLDRLTEWHWSFVLKAMEEYAKIKGEEVKEPVTEGKTADEKDYNRLSRAQLLFKLKMKDKELEEYASQFKEAKPAEKSEWLIKGENVPAFFKQLDEMTGKEVKELDPTAEKPDFDGHLAIADHYKKLVSQLKSEVTLPEKAEQRIQELEKENDFLKMRIKHFEDDRKQNGLALF